MSTILSEIASAAAHHAIDNNGKEATKLILSTATARDIVALGRDQLGDLAQETFTGGTKALVGKKIYGLTVSIGKDEDFFRLE